MPAPRRYREGWLYLGLICRIVWPVGASGMPAHNTLLAGPENTSVILISVDTLRADALSAYGNRDLRTPNIDALDPKSPEARQALRAIAAPGGQVTAH